MGYINVRLCKWENGIVYGYFNTKPRKNKYENIQRESREMTKSS